MAKEEAQELAVIGRDTVDPGTPGAAMVEAFGRGPNGEVSSFKLDSPEGRYLAQKCAEAPDDSLRELVNSTIMVRHVYAHRVDLPNPETGELIPCLRTCLVTPDNKVHACVSDGVRQSVGRLISGHRLPPWDPPLKVTIKQKPTKNGKVRMFLWDESAVEPGKGKR